NRFREAHSERTALPTPAKIPPIGRIPYLVVPYFNEAAVWIAEYGNQVLGCGVLRAKPAGHPHMRTKLIRGEPLHQLNSRTRLSVPEIQRSITVRSPSREPGREYMLVSRYSTIRVKVVGRIGGVEGTAEAFGPGESKAVACIDLICQVNCAVIRLRRSQWHVDGGIGLIVGWSTTQNQVLLKRVRGIQVVVIRINLPVPVDLVNDASGNIRICGAVIRCGIYRVESAVSAKVPLQHGTSLLHLQRGVENQHRLGVGLIGKGGRVTVPRRG